MYYRYNMSYNSRTYKEDSLIPIVQNTDSFFLPGYHNPSYGMVL